MLGAEIRGITETRPIGAGLRGDGVRGDGACYIRYRVPPVKSARRVAERLIVGRAARAHAIAEKLRDLAGQLERYDPRNAGSIELDASVRELKESADQVERL